MTNMEANSPIRIGVAGLGTVGTSLINMIARHGNDIAMRSGRPIVISGVSARDRAKDRGVDLSPYAWEDDMTALAARDDVDVVVELVGGSDGPALTTARNALKGGKAPRVTRGWKASAAGPGGVKTVLQYQQVGGTRYFDAAGIPGRTVGLKAAQKPAGH